MGIWCDIRITYPDFFAFLRQRNLKLGKDQQLMVKKKSIGEKNFYEITWKVPSSSSVAGYVLLPDPPASSRNVFVSIEQLKEVSMVFDIKFQELSGYIVAREAEA